MHTSVTLSCETSLDCLESASRSFTVSESIEVHKCFSSAFQVLTAARCSCVLHLARLCIMATPPAQVCSLCPFRTGCVPELVSHIRLVHHSDPTFSLTCGIDECEKHFKKCSSFLSHVYRHHRQCIVREVRRNNEDEPQLECLTLGEPMLDSPTMPAPDAYALEIREESEPSLLDHTVHHLLGISQNEQEKKSALFILELKEVRGLSEVAIKAVVSGCNNMIEYNNRRLQAAIFEQLSNYGQDPDLHQVFQKVSNPFEGLENVYLLEKYLPKELGCIVS